jgi:hypothetical protein
MVKEVSYERKGYEQEAIRIGSTPYSKDYKRWLRRLPWATMQTMKPYSEDLRRRIVRAVRDGIPKSSASCVFGIYSCSSRYSTTTTRTTGW